MPISRQFLSDLRDECLSCRQGRPSHIPGHRSGTAKAQGWERAWQLPNHNGDIVQQEEGSLEREEAGERSRAPDSKGHAGAGEEFGLRAEDNEEPWKRVSVCSGALGWCGGGSV